MNLPDFLTDVKLNRLRENMGAELFSWNSGRVGKYIDIDKLLEDSGIDIPPEEISAAPDGTLVYEGRKVVVYIRDQYGYRDDPTEQLCKFHVADCSTLRDMRRQNRYERYVVTTRKDGKFIVNFLRENIEQVERRLYVCKNCLGYLNYQDYSRCGYPRKTEIRNSFDLKKFFARYNSQITKEPIGTDISAPRNDYRQGWKKISQRYKETQGWKCEKCGVDLRDAKKYLHVHHKNGLKYNNRDENLCALCISCHAKMPKHQHLKSHPDYIEYINLELPRFGDSVKIHPNHPVSRSSW